MRGRVIAVSTQLRLQCSKERPKKLSLASYLPISSSHSSSLALSLRQARLLSLYPRRLCPPTRTAENFTISPSGKIIYPELHLHLRPSRVESSFLRRSSSNRFATLASGCLRGQESAAAGSPLRAHHSTIPFFLPSELEHGCRCDRTALEIRKVCAPAGKLSSPGGGGWSALSTFLETPVQF